MSHQSQNLECPTAASSKQHVPNPCLKPDKCYCGLKPVKYTCRKQGINYLRQFYRCQKEPQSLHQCHFFQWIQETKGEEYERMYGTSHSNPKHPITSKFLQSQFTEGFEEVPQDPRLHHLDHKNAITIGTTVAPVRTFNAGWTSASSRGQVVALVQ